MKRNFSANTSTNIAIFGTSQFEQKASSKLLVLTLFTDEFHTDYKDISKDLRMTTTPVRQLFEHLGCEFSKENGCFYAKLVMPLTFPGWKPSFAFNISATRDRADGQLQYGFGKNIEIKAKSKQLSPISLQ